MEKENQPRTPKVDIKKMCRMCAKVGKAEIDLFGSYENRCTLSVMLKDYTGISVSQQDRLSTMICKTCHDNLDMCAKLKIKVMEAQTIQQAHSSKSKNKTKGEIGNKKMKMSVRKQEKTSKSSSDNDDIPLSENDEIFQAEGLITITCRVCLKLFTPTTFINHVCDTSTLIPCKKCRLNFKTDEDLEEHDLTVHKPVKKGNKSKKISCVHCDKYFETPEEIEEHLRVVARQKLQIFNCNYCTKFYTDKMACIEHSKGAHPEKFRPKKI